VKLAVTSKQGKEAIVAILGDGEFFGEGCLAGQRLRMATATTMTDCTLAKVDKSQMARMLREDHGASETVRHPFAFTERPLRSGSRRPAFQLERETTGADPVIAVSFPGNHRSAWSFLDCGARLIMHLKTTRKLAYQGRWLSSHFAEASPGYSCSVTA
jgi:hypothetical protein